MIRLNRTTEYGLIALQHMSAKRFEQNDSVTSAREVADLYGLPFEITAKTLQRLKDTGLIASAQGARGGYTLLRPLEEVSLADFLDMMEGPQGVVACATLKGDAKADESVAPTCSYHSRCGIHAPMVDLNHRVQGFLRGIKLAELAGPAPGKGVQSA